MFFWFRQPRHKHKKGFKSQSYKTGSSLKRLNNQWQSYVMKGIFLFSVLYPSTWNFLKDWILVIQNKSMNEIYVKKESQEWNLKIG